MSKQIYTTDEIIFASEEELFFYYWIKEAIEYKFITGFVYQPETLKLSEKVFKLKQTSKNKLKQIHLLHPHVYTPDFMIYTNEIDSTNKKFFGMFGMHIEQDYNFQFMIDVKGGFNRFSGSREFSINQKWVAKEYNVFVNKIVPSKFFKKFWIPAKIRRHSLKKPYGILKRWIGCETYKEKNNKKEVV